MFDRGWLTIAKFKGAPVRLHWTLPLGALVFGRFAFVPGFWLGFVLIVLAHELGHAVLARRQRLMVSSIDVHGLGGHCRFGGYSMSEWQLAVVAWGGVLAQAIVLAIALPISLFAPPMGGFVGQLLAALIDVNLMIALLNLLPIPGLDGSLAWKLPRLWLDRRRLRAMRKEVKRAQPPAPARPPAVRVGQSAKDELGLADIDEAEVRDTVRRALEGARRDSKKKPPS